MKSRKMMHTALYGALMLFLACAGSVQAQTVSAVTPAAVSGWSSPFWMPPAYWQTPWWSYVTSTNPLFWLFYDLSFEYSPTTIDQLGGVDLKRKYPRQNGGEEGFIIWVEKKK